MFKLLATIALIIASLFATLAPAQAYTLTASLPTCTNEDGSIGTNPDGSTIFEDCTWDADTRGNGTGHSFNVIDGQYVYTECMSGYLMAEDYSCVPLSFYAEEPVTPEVVAPTVITPAPFYVEAPVYVAPTATPDLDAAHAWDLFDTFGADLLPTEGGHVELIGANTTGFPYLTADLISVWDSTGTYYLFQIS